MFLLNATMRERMLGWKSHRLELVALIMVTSICKEAGRGRPNGQSEYLCSTFGPLKINEKNVKVSGFSMF